MIFSSGTKKPKIHSSAYVAPTATVSGDVTIGAGCAILHGAIVTSEGAPVTIGAETVVMEHAVVKGTGGSALQFPCAIADRCLVGPHAYIVGASIGAGAYVGSGAVVYNGVNVPPETRVEPKSVQGAGNGFFERVFNVDEAPDAPASAAMSYSRSLRKLHAQDAPVGTGAHVNVKPPARRSAGEEPPAQHTADVEGVVDVMMLELQEMESIRRESQKKQRPPS